MRDGRASIAARNHMIEGAGYAEAWFASNARDGRGRRCNKSILMPDPISMFEVPQSI
jgi:hypothetical protein